MGHDRIVDWFIRRFIVPQGEDIDEPGFIIKNVLVEGGARSIRDLVIAEDLLKEIEGRVVKKYRKKGKQALYSAGKKFGYAYASMTGVPRINACSESKFLEALNVFLRDFESTVASWTEYEVDLKKKTLMIKMKDYTVCRENGMGYFLSEGVIAGIWAYLMKDKSVEAVQIECQGRGAEECELIAAPYTVLKRMCIHNEFMRESKLEEIHYTEVYRQINRLDKKRYKMGKMTKRMVYTQSSLKSLMDAGVVTYTSGILSYAKDRHVICDALLPYALENELRKLKRGRELLFEASFDYAKTLGEKGRPQNLQYITDYFASFGWGEVRVNSMKNGKENYGIDARYFPWCKYSKESSYALFRGLVSGMLSTKRRVILGKWKADTRSGRLVVEAGE
ncbi:MAG: hypothetical protein ABIH99_03950 [Candidatus Micrarchaeota archaeon]